MRTRMHVALRYDRARRSRAALAVAGFGSVIASVSWASMQAVSMVVRRQTALLLRSARFVRACSRQQLFSPGRFRLTLVSALALVAATVVVSAPTQSVGSEATPARLAAAVLAGIWRRVPTAPWGPNTQQAVGVWTGKQLLVFGRVEPHPPVSVDVAAAFTPATNSWRRLSPLTGPSGNFQGHYSAFWTGKEMLVFGPSDFQAYDPQTNRWRRLAAPPSSAGPSGLVVWTGHEMIYWGGGCCEDFLAAGAAFNPATDKWRKLPRSPLAPSQTPSGAWTGEQLVIFVSGLGPEGKPYPMGYARAAAYHPNTNTWRRIEPMPAPRTDAAFVWDGRDVLVVGGGSAPTIGNPASLATSGFAYNPTTNRWRQLAAMSSGRVGFAAVWTGKQVLLWGGTSVPGEATQAPGIVYDPRTDRWAAIPTAPLSPHFAPIAAWTGHAMIVWGGANLRSPYGWFAGGAIFTPATT